MNAKGLLHHGLDTTSFSGFCPTRPYGARERRENLGTRLGWTEVYPAHCVIHLLNNWRQFFTVSSQDGAERIVIASLLLRLQFQVFSITCVLTMIAVHFNKEEKYDITLPW